MSSWGNNDNAANAPYWAVNSTITHTAASVRHATPTAANVAYLYANTSADAYITGSTVGLFGVDAQEAGADHSVTHPGWVLRTVGSGGRAGRVQNEVLVALSGMSADGADGDNQTFANVSIVLSISGDQTVYSNSTWSNTATFSVTPTISGNTNANIVYTWQKNNVVGDAGWSSVANTDVPDVKIAGMSTTTLTVKPKTTANTDTVYRLQAVAADEGVTAYSANATLTIPA